MFGTIVLAAMTTLPFTMFDNRMLVQASLDGKGPFTMIVDTGTYSLVVTPEVARRLGLGTKAGGSATGAGSGSTPRSVTRIPSFALGSLRVTNVATEVLDLAPIRRAIGFPRLDGIIGYSTLGAYRVGVDMDARRLTLSSAPLPVPSAAASVPFSLNGGAIRVSAAVDGVAGKFFVDTGDRWSLTLFRRFAQANDFYRDAPVHNAVTGIGIGGPVYSDVLKTTVSLFGSTISGVVTRASRDRGGVFALGSDDASIGNGLLKRFNIVYDYPDKEIYAWPSHFFSEADRYDPLALNGGALHVERNAEDPMIAPSPLPQLPRHAVFGAAVTQSTSGVRVTLVLAGGPAAQAGLLKDDTIRAINGEPTATVAEFLGAVHDLKAGERVSVDVMRSGAQLRLSLVPAQAQNENDPGVVTQYREIQVDDSLRRTLVTVPPGLSSPAPGVLLIGGIGCYSVDVATNPQDAYMHLTHDLTRAGFVTMRVEKSGVGDSQGPPCRNVDFDAEMRGYASALAALAHDPRVNPARIYLIGHSIGTVIAPILALAGHVAGLIVVEAVGRDWPEYEIRNLRRDLTLDGDAAPATDRALIEKAQCMQRLLFQYESEEAIERNMPSCRVHNGIYPAPAAYMQQVAHRNIIEPWAKLDLPVLAVYGTSDFETELADHQRIVDVANGAHAGSATLVVITGMSHDLGHAATQKDALRDDNRGIIEQYDTEVSAAILAWLRSQNRT
jgi:alpha-beta hydrolase superfamily lysophospholipase